MIDIVAPCPPIVDHDHALDQVDDVELGHRAHAAGDRVFGVQALIQLVTPDPFEVIAALVEKLADEILTGVVERRRITGAHALEELDQRGLGDGLIALQLPLGFVLDRIGDEGTIRIVVDVGVERQQFLIAGCAEAGRVIRHFVADGGERTQQDGDRNRALAVELDRLEFHPRAAVGYQLGVGQGAAGRAILFRVEIDAWRADQLADDDALGAVDDEGALFGHEREIAHENVRYDHLIARLAVDQANAHIKRRCVRQVAFQADLFTVLRFFEPVAQTEFLRFSAPAGEVEFEVAVVAFDRADLVEKLGQPFLDEPAERLELDCDQGRQFLNIGETCIVLDAREALQGTAPLVLATTGSVLYRMNDTVLHWKHEFRFHQKGCCGEGATTMSSDVGQIRLSANLHHIYTLHNLSRPGIENQTRSAPSLACFRQC